VPLDWASTMNNIGNIHYRLGEFNHDAKEFDLAVEAFAAALEERTRERTPSGWASTQNNLANALGGLGGFEDGIKSLSDACDHYRLALQEYPRDLNPIGYADTQYNIALTLLEIAKKTGEKKDFDATRAAIEESHSVYVEAGQTQYESYFENLQLGVQLAETEWVIKKRQKELQAEEQQKKEPQK
jgi:tetratricopeptide (TPR) repeat protein